MTQRMRRGEPYDACPLCGGLRHVVEAGSEGVLVRCTDCGDHEVTGRSRR